MVSSVVVVSASADCWLATAGCDATQPPVCLLQYTGAAPHSVTGYYTASRGRYNRTIHGTVTTRGPVQSLLGYIVHTGAGQCTLLYHLPRPTTPATRLSGQFRDNLHCLTEISLSIICILKALECKLMPNYSLRWRQRDMLWHPFTDLDNIHTYYGEVPSVRTTPTIPCLLSSCLSPGCGCLRCLFVV